MRRGKYNVAAVQDLCFDVIAWGLLMAMLAVIFQPELFMPIYVGVSVAVVAAIVLEVWNGG